MNNGARHPVQEPGVLLDVGADACEPGLAGVPQMPIGDRRERSVEDRDDDERMRPTMGTVMGMPSGTDLGLGTIRRELGLRH